MRVGSYLTMPDPAPASSRPNPSDGAGVVLDVIDTAGSDGADMDMLQRKTGFDEPYLRQVLSSLQSNGMAVISGARYQLTGLGAKARYIVAR